MRTHHLTPTDRADIRQRILDTLRENGPMTMAQIGDRLGLSANKIGASVRRYPSYFVRGEVTVSAHPDLARVA